MKYEDVQAPFLLNLVKHHAGYIKSFVEGAKTGSVEPEIIRSKLVKVGGSMIDIYYGILSPSKIVKEVEKTLKSMDCFDQSAYSQYITSSPKNFKTINLRDGTSWTLLIGKSHERYIHIHPCRNSLYTIRAKALTLKTAVYLKVFYADQLNDLSIVKLANEVRENYLEASPIKGEKDVKGLIRVLNLM